MLLTDKRCSDMQTGDYDISNTYIFIRNYQEPDGSGAVGSFRHLYMDEWQPYTSISNLIFQLELFLEQINIPQASTLCRKSWEREKSRPDAKVPVPILKNPVRTQNLPGKASYLIYIRYRQNSSWQGEIRWLAQNKTMFFRSVLELIMLLENSAMSYN